MNSTKAPSSRHPFARLALPLLLPLAGLAACDTATEASGGEGIEGNWTSVNEVDPNLAVYLEITSGTVTIANGELNGCFYILVFDLSNDGDDQYTLTPTSSGSGDGSLAWTVTRDGENLTVIDEAATLTLEPTNVRISNLEECTT